MATVYSLICFGGKDGKTVTMTIASPCVVTLTNHGLRAGTGVVFTTTGALPTGVTSGSTYYAGNIAANTFNLYNTSANAITGGATGRVNTSGSQSGTHTVKSAYYVGLSDKSRWTVGGTEYIYDSLASWNTGRAGASAFDTEVCEIGMSWSDFRHSLLQITVPSAKNTITTMVNGVRGAGWHGGTYPAATLTLTSGYCFESNTTVGSGDWLYLGRYNDEIDGIIIRHGANYGISNAVNLYAGNNKIRNSFVIGFGTNGTGIYVRGPLCQSENNVVAGWSVGVQAVNYSYGSRVFNNTVVKNVTGFNSDGATYGYWYNNISLGNTTNWDATTGAAIEGATKNAGNTGEAWLTGSGTRVEITEASPYTATFVGYSSNNFRPVAASQLIDAGASVYGASGYDIAGGEVPSYNNGGSEVTDIGAFEYDKGYGNHPVVRTIDFSGLVSGSQVVVYTTSTTTELARNNSTGTTYSYDAAASGVTVDYTILKTGYKPIRVTGVALTATSTPITVQQDLDRAYVAPSGLTFGTNVIVNVTSRVVTSMQVTTSTTVQNWYSYLMDCWIDSTTNTTLKNVAFPVIPFGEASFTTINGIEFSDGATSISKFKRDGFRYSSDAGVTATAIWAAILTLNTPAGQQVKYRQATAGTITNAQNTGPMDQLVQVYGDASHGNFDYRGHMVLRAPKVGWSQPKPDLVATYGNLVDGLFVAALEPVLQYATTDADIDATHLVLDNTAKTYTISAAHTMLELYQRAQWWANQDAQWDADIPLTTTDGSTFTQPSTWSMSGVSYLTGGTLSGGSATLAAGTQGIAYNGVTMNLGAAGTYTFTMAGSCTVKVTPTSPSTYIFGSGTFNGTLTVNNMAAHAITIEIPNGVTTSTTGNTGGAITFTAPAIYQSVTVSGITTTSRIQIYDTTHNTQLYNGVPGATSYTWTDSVAAASTRAIRVRIADVVGATAKNFIEANIGTCAVSGSGKDISYLASQTNDTTYNSNAINGPTIYATSGITFTDAATDLVNCNIGGGSVTYPTIYACFVYWNFTATGIANDFTYVDAPDTANYLFSGMKIRNTSATDLMVTGGYGRDATTLTSAAIIDTAGSTGNIFLAPDHVVAYQTTGTYAITGDISTVLTAVSNVPPAVWTEATRTITGSGVTAGDKTDIISGVFSQAQATPIQANVKQVNGTALAGAGVPGNSWRPA